MARLASGQAREAAQAEAVADPRPHGRRGARGGFDFGLILILAAQFMIVLDGSIVTVALPSIQRSLGFSAVGSESVITAYNTAFAGALILLGRLADLVGKRRVFIIGMAMFAVSSLLCGVASGPVMLVSARVLQGLSAAAIAPSALALLSARFAEGPTRNRAMSMFGIATVLGFVGGLVLSGLLVAAAGWRAVFWVTVPVGLIAAVLTPRWIAQVPRQRHRIDIPGAVLITAAMAALVAAPAVGASAGWASAPFLALLAGGAVLLLAFSVNEIRHPAPLIPPGFLRNRIVRTANVVSLAAGAMPGAGYVLLTMYMQQVLHFSPLQAGLVVVPTGVLNLITGLYAGKLVTRFGLRRTMTAATAAGGGMIAAVASQVAPGQSGIVLAAVILPMGVVFLYTTVSTTIGTTTGVRKDQQGLAGGLRQTTFQLGTALGVSILVSLAAAWTRHLQSSAVPGGTQAALAGGYRLGLTVLAVAVVTVAVFAWVGLRPSSREHAEQLSQKPSSDPRG